VAEITAAAVKALRDQTGAGMMDCKRALQDAGGEVKRAVELLRERGLAKAGRREGRATSEGVIAIALDGGVGGMVELGCETDFVAKTADFQELAASLARSLVDDAGIDGREALLDSTVDGEKVSEKISGAIGKMGENILLNRCERIAVEGSGRVGGYVHAGGKLGVVIGLATEASGEALDVLAKDLAMHVAAADPSPVAVDRDGVPQQLIDRERDLFRRQAEQEGKPAKVIDKIVEGRIKKYYGEVCLLEQGFVKDPDKSLKQLLEEVGAQLSSPVGVTCFVRYKLGEGVSE
jgi:elongation factor Ts